MSLSDDLNAADPGRLRDMKLEMQMDKMAPARSDRRGSTADPAPAAAPAPDRGGLGGLLGLLGAPMTTRRSLSHRTGSGPTSARSCATGSGRA